MDFPGYVRRADGILVDKNGWPRRSQVFQWVPAEHAIQEAVFAVEQAGADVRLTRAVILLGQARDLVADFVEARPITEEQ